ncbi:MAG: GIY-YIG nuclease family protein [Patescibacteria group bacterium]
MYYVYVLQLKDKSFYIGFTSNLKNRIIYHNQGLVPSTKNYRPVLLLHYSAFLTQKKATDFEKYLKTLSGFAFRNKRLI